MKKLGHAKSAAEFQGLDSAVQSKVFAGLRDQGVSIRQLARLSGISKGVCERLCRTTQDA
jgi:lambda repressor-like predicted transcriptional regulator